MENKQEKTAAELYREERKQRMAKAAKKNARKSPQLHRAGRVVGKCLLTVIIVALCLSIVYACLSFSGVLQRNILSAFKLGKQRVSVAEYNYYYLEMYSRVAYTANQYDNNYGAGYGKTYTGFDTSLPPEKQSYTLGEVEGVENPTWADYFKETAKQQIQLITAFAKFGRDAGITLSDEEKEEIESSISEYATAAKNNDFSLNRYLDNVLGKGVNEKLLRRILEDRSIATAYAEKYDEDLQASITDEQIEEEFKKNIKDYTTFTIGLFEVKADIPEADENASEEETEAAKTEAMAAAQARANEILTTIDSADSFVAAATAYDSALTSDSVIAEGTSATTINNYAPDAVDWVYEEGRAVGDKAVFEVSDGYYVVYLIKLPEKDTTKGVDVRHILVQFQTTTDDDGNTVELTAEEKAEYMAKAQEIYDLYKAEPTEDKFAELATEYTEDTGSKETGGLYEDVYPGDMVTEFNDWIFDAARQPGDTDIIETTYGYHIMYYVGNDNPEKWASDVKNVLVNNLSNTAYESVKSNSDYVLTESTAVINWATDKLNKFIASRNVSSSN